MSERRRKQVGSGSAGALAFAVAAALFVAGPREARAQADDWTMQTSVEAKIPDLGASDKVFNVRLWVDGKIYTVSGSDLILRGADSIRVLVDNRVLGRYQPLLDELREGDNVRIFGFMTLDPQSKMRVFNVEKIDRRETDAQLYRERIDKVKDDKDALFKIAAEIEADLAQPRADPGLRPLLDETYETAIALLEKSAKPDDPAAAVAIADLYAQKLKNRQSALDWLVKTIPQGGSPSPEVFDRIVKINAVHYGGEWILYEEMKKREGFVLRGDQWVLAEHAEFLDAVEARLKGGGREALTSSREFCQGAAQRGQVIVGMLKKEVASAIGFPDDVDRVRRSVAGQPHVYDAWVYEGRGMYIFEDNVLFKRP